MVEEEVFLRISHELIGANPPRFPYPVLEDKLRPHCANFEELADAVQRLMQILGESHYVRAQHENYLVYVDQGPWLPPPLWAVYYFTRIPIQYLVAHLSEVCDELFYGDYHKRARTARIVAGLDNGIKPEWFTPIVISFDMCGNVFGVTDGFHRMMEFSKRRIPYINSEIEVYWKGASSSPGDGEIAQAEAKMRDILLQSQVVDEG